MTEDARFEDGAERPLRLRAFDAEDLAVMAALAQDAVFPGSEMTWQRRQRRFSILLNRFRWEDKTAAERRGRKPERVRSVLAIEDVSAIRSTGIDRSADTVYCLLDISFAQGADGAGIVTLTLAGDGAIEVAVEVLELTLTDVTRPYVAPSGKAPDHPL